MPERSDTKLKPIRIGLLGASFHTGNMGVSALAESSIKCILNRWPNAQIILLGSGYVPGQHLLFLMGKEISVKTLPIRFSKNIFLPYHILWFAFYGLLARVLPRSRFKDTLVKRNPYFRMFFEADLVANITGGDSFSDIYGFRRFFLGFLSKWLAIFLGKKLVLLPQTYGPFRRPLTKVMARYILKHASLVYSRDRAGVEYVNKLLNDSENGKVRFAPDVAFVLDSRKPKQLDIEPSADIRAQNSIVVGLNVSGLLFNGGYSRNNMFGLKTDYRELICEIIKMLLKEEEVVVLLIPHVFPPAGYEVESDSDACLKIYEQLRQIYPGRIFLVKGEYDQGEIKHIIGLSDFFIGSRMHSCVAALSQNIPTVGLAYSKKFSGVFDSVGIGNLAIDMRQNSMGGIFTTLSKVFKERNAIREHLKNIIPETQRKALNIFQDVLSQASDIRR